MNISNRTPYSQRSNACFGRIIKPAFDSLQQGDRVRAERDDELHGVKRNDVFAVRSVTNGYLEAIDLNNSYKPVSLGKFCPDEPDGIAMSKFTRMGSTSESLDVAKVPLDPKSDTKFNAKMDELWDKYHGKENNDIKCDIFVWPDGLK